MERIGKHNYRKCLVCLNYFIPHQKNLQVTCSRNCRAIKLRVYQHYKNNYGMMDYLIKWVLNYQPRFTPLGINNSIAKTTIDNFKKEFQKQLDVKE